MIRQILIFSYVNSTAVVFFLETQNCSEYVTMGIFRHMVFSSAEGQCVGNNIDFFYCAGGKRVASSTHHAPSTVCMLIPTSCLSTSVCPAVICLIASGVHVLLLGCRGNAKILGRSAADKAAHRSAQVNDSELLVSYCPPLSSAPSYST